MPARKYEYISLSCSSAIYDAVRPSTDVLNCLASWAAIAKKLPTGALNLNIRSAPALVVAVVPFDEIGIDFHGISKASQFARPHRSLQRTGEYRGKR
jgi:hypothetical protein